MIFQTAKFTRDTLVTLLNELSLAQLTKIPKGFKNNIIWNIGHILVTEQLLNYKLSGLPMIISADFVTLYGKGSIPNNKVSLNEIIQIKQQLIPAIQQTQKDYKKGVFKTFNQYPTSTGIILNNIEDAFLFNSFHEGIHLGIILAIKKLV